MQKKIKRMNTGMFLGIFLFTTISQVIQLMMGIVIFSIISNDNYSMLSEISNNRHIMLLFWGYFFSVLGIWLICVILFHYRMWAAIHDEYVNTPPAIAVLRLFIPIYNIYWMFNLYPDFVEYYEMYLNRNNIEVPPFKPLAHRVFPKLILAIVILDVLTRFLPFLFIHAGLFNLAVFIVFLVVVYRTCTAVNALADAVERGS
ncbi:MAG: hypothetical protein JW885_03290 [Deltaproteobacteria bacterium]|nr:hypothetical protein [Candidatus Zymogenaceae bacterium]